MSKPTFLIGEIVRSDTSMGKIVIAFYRNSNWVYSLEVEPGSQPLEIAERHIKSVWREGKWLGS